MATNEQDPVIISNKNRSRDELASLTFAEENRQQQWKSKSFLASIYMGDLDIRLCTPFPEQAKADREVGDKLCDQVDQWAKDNIDGEAIDREGRIPPHVMQGMHKLKLFCLKIPKEYGGLGLSQTNYMRVLSVITKYCGACVTLLSAHQSIGVPQPLKLFGTKSQREKYLPRIVAGEITAFALTEYEVGSDPANLQTQASLAEDGTSWILNGTKLWCTNGVIADLYVVMARTPDIVKNGKNVRQVTAFLVEAKWQGVDVVHRSEFMGLRGIENGVIRFDQVKVPKENVIGDVGQGLKLALATLNDGRLSIPAISASGGQVIASTSNTWAKSRSQWGKAVGYHEPGAEKVAYINACAYAIDTFSYYCAQLSDSQTVDIRMEAAASKLWCTEELWKVVDTAIQLRGGRGYETKASLEKRGETGVPLERVMRDIRVNRILEGSSEIMHLFLAREALDTHFKKAGVLLSKASLKEKWHALLACVRFYPLWYIKLCLGLVFGSMTSYSNYDPSFRGSLKWISKTGKKLALTLFHKMLFLGPKLEFKQLTLSRIIDIGIELSVLTLVLSRVNKEMKNGDNKHQKLAIFWSKQRQMVVNNLFKELNKNTDDDAVTFTKELLKNTEILSKPSSDHLKPISRLYGKDLLNGNR